MELKRALRKVAELKITEPGIGMTAVAAILLAGCSGGGSSAPTTSTLGGVAAVGYPVVNGNINVNCAAGSALATTTNNTGVWLITLSGQTLPCAVQVNGGTINNAANTAIYHSIATSEGTINITPLTDLMVANLAGTATPSVWFSGLSATTLTAITQANVDAALAKLRTALSGLPALSTINPITTAFTPASGNAGDDILTALKMAMSNTGVTHGTMLNNASFPTFTAFVTGFNTALTAAYSGTASGSPTPTPTANPFINSSWSGTATVTNSNTNNGCTSSTWTATIDSAGLFTGSTSSNCGDVAMLVGTVDSSGTTSFGYAGGNVCTFSGRFSVSPTRSASGTFTCSDAGASASGTWTGTGSGGNTSGSSTSGGQTAGTVSCQLSGSNAYITLCNTYGSHIKTSCSAGETTVASCSGTNTCTSTGSDSSWVTTNYFGGSMFSSVTSMYQSNCTAATGTWR